MHLSIITDELGLEIGEALPIIKSWGVEYVDLRSRMFGRTLERLTGQGLRQVKGLLDDHGLKVGALQSSLAKAHLPDAALCRGEADKLERLIKAADVLDCRLVRSFCFWQPPKEEVGQLGGRPDMLEQVMDRFGPLAGRARKAGLTLAFENCGMLPDEVFAVLDALGVARWGLAWDARNYWHRPEHRQDEVDYIIRCAKRSRLVHVKAAGAVAGLDRQTLPWDRILATCAAAGLEGPVSVETHNPDQSLSNVEMSHRLVAAVRRAWPTAAPGLVEEAARPIRQVSRPYTDNPVGFVVLGLGMGKARAKDILATPGARLVGVADIREERARDVGDELEVPHSRDLKPWLDNDDVEVVYVMTPTGRHAEGALQALRAGKHVLVTKPMEASLGACDAMIREAEACGLLLGVDFDLRFRPECLALKAAVRDGRLGRLLSGHSTLKLKRTTEYFRAGGGWRGTRRWDGGGVLSNQNIHHLDQIVFTVGVPHRVRCNIWTQAHDIEAEDLGCAVLNFADGAVITVYATTAYPQQTWYYELELHGTEGAVSLASGGPLEVPRSRWFFDGAWGDEPPRPVEPQWLNAADNFAAALRTGAPLVCSGRDARRTQAVLHALYESAYGGQGWVEVNADIPEP